MSECTACTFSLDTATDAVAWHLPKQVILASGIPLEEDLKTGLEKWDEIFGVLSSKEEMRLRGCARNIIEGLCEVYEFTGRLESNEGKVNLSSIVQIKREE